MNKANIRKNYKKNALNEISAATIFEYLKNAYVVNGHFCIPLSFISLYLLNHHISPF